MLPAKLILYPMAVMVLLTFVVMAILPFVRFMAVKAGKSKPKDYLYGDSSSEKSLAKLVGRNYTNLFEAPTLFYVLCLLIFETGLLDQITLRLAWAFVGFRLAHSLVHIIFNRLLMRMTIFIISVLVLMGMWAYYLWLIIGH